jgi:hypothetical protein
MLEGGGIPGLFVSLTLRGDFQSLKALCAFVRLSILAVIDAKMSCLISVNAQP